MKAKRRSTELKATVGWEEDLNSFVLSAAYLLTKEREELTKIKWEVDHIIPLQGERVCGLHWYPNIQVIPQYENRSKGNKYDL